MLGAPILTELVLCGGCARRVWDREGDHALCRRHTQRPAEFELLRSTVYSLFLYSQDRCLACGQRFSFGARWNRQCWMKPRPEEAAFDTDVSARCVGMALPALLPRGGRLGKQKRNTSSPSAAWMTSPQWPRTPKLLREELENISLTLNVQSLCEKVW